MSVKIKIDKRGLDRAIRLWQSETGQSMAAAINEANVQWHDATRTEIKRAKKGQISRFGKSETAKGLAISRLIKKGRKPTQKAVDEYVSAMVQAKKRAVGFTRALVNAGKIKARGQSPKRPAGVKATGQKASRSQGRNDAWVKITYRYKGGDRADVERMILAGYDRASTKVAEYVQKRIEARMRRAKKRLEM